jgi:DNA-binding NtrC family response regulator
MATRANQEVVLVGFGAGPDARLLSERMRAAGLHTEEAQGLEELAHALRDFPRAAIVVYSPEESLEARRVLQLVHAGLGANPVVVVVDRSEFSSYYGLMADGAAHYFELGEQPERIVQGVIWADRGRLV